MRISGTELPSITPFYHASTVNFIFEMSLHPYMRKNMSWSDNSLWSRISAHFLRQEVTLRMAGQAGIPGKIK